MKILINFYKKKMFKIGKIIAITFVPGVLTGYLGFIA
jgi:hypothetical protein